MTSVASTFKAIAILFLCMMVMGAFFVFVFRSSPWCQYIPVPTRQPRAVIPEPQPQVQMQTVIQEINIRMPEIDYIVARVVRKEEMQEIQDSNGTKDEDSNEFVPVAVAV